MPKNVAFGPSGPTYGDDFTLIPAGTVRTATFSTGARGVGYIHTLRLALVVTAASGTTPNMVVTMEGSPDGTTGWVALNNGALTAVTAPGTTRKIVSALDRYVRATAVITGTTPSFTFGLIGESVGGENSD